MAPANTSEFVYGDITEGQKILGDLVEKFLPGRSRADIESILGPSLDTPYFRETGRDLIYVLGPQRNSFFPIDPNGSRSGSIPPVDSNGVRSILTNACGLTIGVDPRVGLVM